MFDAFIKDKTRFKFYFLIKFVLGLILCVGAVFLSIMYSDAHSDNNNKRTTFESERAWIQGFDYRKALQVQKEIITPCQQAEVMNVIRAHTGLFKDNGVFIRDISTSDFKTVQSVGKGANALKFVTTTVTVDGSWDGVRNALNKFEKNDFIAITHCKLSASKSVNGSNPTVSGTIVFRTFYK